MSHLINWVKTKGVPAIGGWQGAASIGNAVGTGLFGLFNKPASMGSIPLSASPNPYAVNPYAVNPYDQNAEAFRTMQGMQEQAIEQEGQAQEAQAKLAVDEAQAEAIRVGSDAKAFRENQANQYSASGVLLEGSPMLVLAETETKARAEVNALMNRGQALASLLRQRGNIAQLQGRAQLLGQETDWTQKKNSYDLQSVLFQNQGAMFDIQQAANMADASRQMAINAAKNEGSAPTIGQGLQTILDSVVKASYYSTQKYVPGTPGSNTNVSGKTSPPNMSGFLLPINPKLKP